MKRGASVVAVVGALLLGACGSGGDTAPGTFTVDFPSTAAAIAVLKNTQGVQVFAFSTTSLGGGEAGAAGACETLVEQSRTNDMMTTGAAATSALLTPCQLKDGEGSLALGYGSYAFLAVAATSAGDALLVGCAEQTLSATNTVVTIPMTLASASMTIAPTMCTSLSQVCPGGGGC